MANEPVVPIMSAKALQRSGGPALVLNLSGDVDVAGWAYVELCSLKKILRMAATCEHHAPMPIEEFAEWLLDVVEPIRLAVGHSANLEG
jgi:hypothetical protein